MLDYHFDYVAFRTFVSQLEAISFPDDTLADAQVSDVQIQGSESAAALTGAFVYQLLGHAASDGSEITLLARAADLWEKGRALCDELGGIRQDIEDTLASPTAPDATARFDAAAVRAQELANTAAGLRADVEEVRAEALSFRHVPAHPRQADRPSSDWGWEDLLLGRRTQALVTTMLLQATDPRTRAVALGAVSSYGAQVAGASYLGHGVGGPRRSQRIRERIARNAVGQWLAEHHASTRPPSDIASQLEGGAGPDLPVDVESFLVDAITATYDLGVTESLPSLQTGWTRLLAHLRLMDRFAAPEPPAAPAVVWSQQLWADPASPPASLRPQDVDVTLQDGGGVAATTTTDPSPGSTSSTESDVKKGCGIAFLILILLDLVQAFVHCIVQWAKSEECTFWKNMLLSKLWEQDPPDPRDPTNPNSTSEGLTAIGSHPQTLEFIGILHETHQQVYEVMERARAFLASTGLIYPARTAGLPLFEQFVSLPERGFREDWPHAEEADPTETYFRYPTSAIEQPSKQPSPYGPGATPLAPLDASGPLSASAIALTLWAQTITGTVDEQNLDLDADRGLRHLCWEASGLISDVPLQVHVLGYADQ